MESCCPHCGRSTQPTPALVYPDYYPSCLRLRETTWEQRQAYGIIPAVITGGASANSAAGQTCQTLPISAAAIRNHATTWI